MSAAVLQLAEHSYAGDPVLVDRAEACAILGVTEATFDRLRREGRFEDVVSLGPLSLYRSAELRAYRAAARRRGKSRNVTSAISQPSKSAHLRVTSEWEIAGCTGERSEPANHTWAICEGCQKPFRPHRAGQLACSPACRQRARRQSRAAA